MDEHDEGCGCWGATARVTRRSLIGRIGVGLAALAIGLLPASARAALPKPLTLQGGGDGGSYERCDEVRCFVTDEHLIVRCFNGRGCFYEIQKHLVCVDTFDGRYCYETDTTEIV